MPTETRRQLLERRERRMLAQYQEAREDDDPDELMIDGSLEGLALVQSVLFLIDRMPKDRPALDFLDQPPNTETTP